MISFLQLVVFCLKHTLSGQGLQVLFKMVKCLYTFTNISAKHKQELFDELILQIRNYAGKDWGFNQGHAIERFHLQLCKTVKGF